MINSLSCDDSACLSTYTLVSLCLTTKGRDAGTDTFYMGFIHLGSVETAAT